MHFKWETSVQNIAPDIWAQCYPEQEILKSYQLQVTLEKSNIVDNFYYLLVFVDNKIVAIVSCFKMRYCIADIAPAFIQKK